MDCGRKLAEILQLPTIGSEGHDVKGPCVECDSSDAFRVHEETGVAYCHSCGGRWSPLQLSQEVLGSEELAWRALEESGLEKPRSDHGRGPGGRRELTESNAASDLAPIDKAPDYDNEEYCRQMREYIRQRSQELAPKTFAAVAESKGVRVEDLKAYGAQAHGDVLMFRTYGPNGEQCSTFTMGADGKGKNAAGKPAGCFLPDGHKPAAGETWIICEGPKDAAAWRSLGFLAIGVPGSAMNKKFAPLLAGVHVILVGDLDTAGQSGVDRTGRVLVGITASIKVARLPGEVKASHGDDVRDVLKRPDGAELVRKAIAEAVDWVPPVQEPEEPGTIKLLADQITLVSHFAQDAGGRLYRYVDGAYRPTAAAYIKREVKRLLHQEGLTAKWSSRLGNEVIEYIRVDAPQLWDRPPLDIVNVRDGLLQVKGRKLEPHTPDFLSPVQLPVSYDPAATCPQWEKFVAETFPPDAIELAWEIPAWLMLPDTSIQKAVLLTGEGANGKSRCLAGVQAFLGTENVCGLSLHRLESDRFCVARMIGRLANICPDLPSEHLASTSVFKALTGGDALTAEYKFRDSFEFRPFIRLVFSANFPPQSQDGSHGFFRRWIVIPFSRTFADAEQIDSVTLDAMLADPGELSGLLNKAVDAFPRIEKRRALSEPPSVMEAAREFRAATDPLAVWLDQNTIVDPAAYVPKAVLHAAYTKAAAKAGRPTMSANAFGRAVSRLRPNLENVQRKINSKVAWAYAGIGLADSHHSRHSLDSPYLFNTREGGNEQREEGEKLNSGSSIQIRANRVNGVNGVNGHLGGGCPKCRSQEFRDTPIHGGNSMRRDCARCGYMIGFKDWDGTTARPAGASQD